SHFLRTCLLHEARAGGAYGPRWRRLAECLPPRLAASQSMSTFNRFLCRCLWQICSLFVCTVLAVILAHPFPAPSLLFRAGFAFYEFNAMPEMSLCFCSACSATLDIHFHSPCNE